MSWFHPLFENKLLSPNDALDIGVKEANVSVQRGCSLHVPSPGRWAVSAIADAGKRILGDPSGDVPTLSAGN